MKITEIAIHLMMKTSIFEMAFARAEAIKKVSELQFEIAEHLIKVFMYSESEFVNHWCNELNSWLRKVQRYKPKSSKKPLPYEVLRKILWEQPLESIDEVQSIMNEVSYDYQNVKINEPDAQVVHKHVEDVLSKICADISENKFRDVGNYLNIE